MEWTIGLVLKFYIDHVFLRFQLAEKKRPFDVLFFSYLGSADRWAAGEFHFRYEKSKWARLKLYELKILFLEFFLIGLVLNFQKIYTFPYFRCLDCDHLFVFIVPIGSNSEKRCKIIPRPQSKWLILKCKYYSSCPRALSILFHPKYTHTIWISVLSSQK